MKIIKWLVVPFFCSLALLLPGCFNLAVASEDVNLKFFGKVVDDIGQPVPGAIVKIGISHWDPSAEYLRSTKKIEIKTDALGKFKLSGRGKNVFIYDIKRLGYEYSRSQNKDTFQYGGSVLVGEKLFVANSQDPVVFHLRKRATVDYLLTNSFTWNFRKSNNKPIKPRLFKTWLDPYGKARNMDTLGASSLSKNKPLEITCSFNEDYSEFQLIFQCDANDCGVILSQDVLYEAPAEGYHQKKNYNDMMVQEVNDGNETGWHDKKLYLYVKGPAAMYYSRIDLVIGTRPMGPYFSDAVVQVSGKIYTNPEGRRHLDFDSSYNDAEDRVRREVKKERDKMVEQSWKEEKAFDEKTFKEKVDKERKANL